MRSKQRKRREGEDGQEEDKKRSHDDDDEFNNHSILPRKVPMVIFEAELDKIADASFALVRQLIPSKNFIR